MSKPVVMALFRELPKQDNAVEGRTYRDENLETIFQESKTKIIEEIEEWVQTLIPDPSVAVPKDFSCDRISPNYGKTGCKLIAFNSRLIYPMEKKYNPMEWEAQSMAGGLKKSQHSILRSDKEDLAMDQKKTSQIAQKQKP